MEVLLMFSSHEHSAKTHYRQKVSYRHDEFYFLKYHSALITLICSHLLFICKIHTKARKLFYYCGSGHVTFFRCSYFPLSPMTVWFVH